MWYSPIKRKNESRLHKKNHQYVIVRVHEHDSIGSKGKKGVRDSRVCFDPGTIITTVGVELVLVDCTSILTLESSVKCKKNEHI